MYNSNSYKKQGRGMFFLLFVIAALFALSGVVMWLWNQILPHTVNVGVLSFWEAMGLLVLCRILFGGFKFGGGRPHKPPFGNSSFRDKFIGMSDEEKAKFREQWKERCDKKNTSD